MAYLHYANQLAMDSVFGLASADASSDECILCTGCIGGKLRRSWAPSSTAIAYCIRSRARVPGLLLPSATPGSRPIKDDPRTKSEDCDQCRHFRHANSILTHPASHPISVTRYSSAPPCTTSSSGPSPPHIPAERPRAQYLVYRFSLPSFRALCISPHAYTWNPPWP